jgi:hypothetical protein
MCVTASAISTHDATPASEETTGPEGRRHNKNRRESRQEIRSEIRQEIRQEIV